MGTPIFDRGEQDFAHSDSIVTIPNLITLVRLACIPLFVWMLFGLEARFGAALLLGGLGATDWVDGYLARLLDQHSALGKVLDPLTDRLMFLVAIIAMMIDRSVPFWFAVAVLVRETLVSLAALVVGALGVRSIDVTWIGKMATFGLMFAFPLFLASHSDVGDNWTTFFGWAGWIIGIPSLILSYQAAVGYVPIAREAIAEAASS